MLDHLGIDAPVPRAPPTSCSSARRPTTRRRSWRRRSATPTRVVADSTAERERLWRLREAHTEAIAAAGVPHKLDVGVPPARLAAFADAARAAVAEVAPGARVILFGHLGDGNVHVNVLGRGRRPRRRGGPPVAAEHGGTISAEHGVGVAKAAYLGLVRSAAELRAMRAVKRALDPAGLLNPGAVLG